MPHSNMKQLFGTIRRLLYKWSNEFITFGSYRERKASADQYEKQSMFKNTTIAVDSIDLLLVKQNNQRGKSLHHSYRSSIDMAQEFKFLLLIISYLDLE